MVMSRVMLSEMLSEMSPKGFYTDFFFFLFFSLMVIISRFRRP